VCTKAQHELAPHDALHTGVSRLSLAAVRELADKEEAQTPQKKTQDFVNNKKKRTGV
jgi:hypothetical protein